MPYISNINTWAAYRPSGASLAVFMNYSSGCKYEFAYFLSHSVSGIFHYTILICMFIGRHKILCAMYYLEVPSGAFGDARCGSRCGRAAQKSPCRSKKTTEAQHNFASNSVTPQGRGQPHRRGADTALHRRPRQGRARLSLVSQRVEQLNNLGARMHTRLVIYIYDARESSP